MEPKHELFMRIFQESGISAENTNAFWEISESIQIPKNTNLNSAPFLQSKGFFLEEGCLREYFIDKNGTEHTMRLIVAPQFIYPSLARFFLNKEPKLISESLTPMKGRAWSFVDMLRYTELDPSFNKVIINRVFDAIVGKHQMAFNKYKLSATELYKYFLSIYPGITNKIPLKYIASYLKLSPETISRIRAGLNK